MEVWSVETVVDVNKGNLLVATLFLTFRGGGLNASELR